MFTLRQRGFSVFGTGSSDTYHQVESVQERDALQQASDEEEVGLSSNLTTMARDCRIRVVIYQPRMSPGGAQQITLTLLNHLDRNRFASILVLRMKDGEWLDRIPSDIPIHYLDSRVRSAWFKLGRLLREISPDVTLSMSTMGNLTVCLGHFFGRINTPLVVSELNTYSQALGTSRLRFLWISFLKYVLYRRAARIVAVSRGVAGDLLRSARIPKSKLMVIYSPVFEEKLHGMSGALADHPWFGDGPPVILAAARLAPQKDFPMLLESFRRLRRERPARLMILGDGELRQELEELAEDLGIADHVAFLGFVNNPLSYMKRCTIFSLSSRYEGLPIALLEAMACGTPVVSTDCPSGPSEIISHGKDGLLVPVGDAEAMASAIKLLLDDPHLRNQIGERARERAARFSVANAVLKYADLLESLADR